MVTLDHSPVVSDPKILGGTLVFRGTRVKAQTLLDYIVAGDYVDVFLEHFPSVDPLDAKQFSKLVYEENHS